MCGIAGLLDPSATSHAERLAHLATEMAGTLAHRGPDDAGTWVDAATGVGLGHRRLSVVDLSPTGSQPMTSESGRYTISFNGEVYDHVELRARLEAAGHSFRGTSDTEVLLAAVEEWGLDGALRRCEAMFAMALWDRRERVLLLARDRIGEKPLYYGRAGDHLVFGSELSSLRAHPDFRGEIDREALALYLRHTYVPAPHCIYRHVRKLPAGTILTIDPGSASPLDTRPVPFWSLRDVVERGAASPFAGSADDAVDAVEEALAEAVRLRLRADVPVGAFLSGGIDSSLVVALAEATGVASPVRTFTVAIPDMQLDESREAAAVAAHLGTRHTSVDLSATDALELIPRLPELYDEPFSDPSQLPTLLVSRVARESVTVALSGDGGDESFGGYNRHVYGPMAWQRLRHLPRPLRTALARGALAIEPRRWDALGRRAGSVHRRLDVPNVGDKVHKLARIAGLATEDELYLALASQWDDPAVMVGLEHEPRTVATDPAAWPTGLSSTERMLFLDTVMALADGMLCKVDRASMAVGLEARVPLLDHRVVELAWRLPLSLRIRGGEGKWILRQILDRHVPRQLTERPKVGFDPPIAAWLRGPLRTWADDLLSPHRLRDQGWIDPAPVRKKWDEHQSGARNWDYHLWTVLQFQSWLDAT